jgi:hypothetical protein
MYVGARLTPWRGGGGVCAWQGAFASGVAVLVVAVLRASLISG